MKNFKNLSHELPGNIMLGMVIAFLPILIIWNLLNTRIMMEGYTYLMFLAIYMLIIILLNIWDRIAYIRYQNSILKEKYMERIVWQIKNERPEIEIFDTMKRWAEIDKKFAEFLKSKNVL
jgi:hypothetical protein